MFISFFRTILYRRRSLFVFNLPCSFLYVADYAKVDSENGRLFMWTNPRYYKLLQVLEWKRTEANLVRVGGPFAIYSDVASAATVVSTPAIRA